MAYDLFEHPRLAAVYDALDPASSGRCVRRPTDLVVSWSSWHSGLRTEVEQVEVFAILGALEAAGIPMWVAGGWGVDALAGRQTRAHRDLDLPVDAEKLEECLNLLAARGYVVETDWLPVRVEVATQFDYPTDCFTTGNLEGREVPCLTATHQRLLHAGYQPRAQDVLDLGLLTKLGGANPG